jgi:prevent-host-death family protein
MVFMQDPEERAMSTDNNTATARTIKASEFKAKCLKLMDEVAENGGEIVITKHGRPTARLVAYREKPQTLFGIDRGKLEILGDVVAPVDVEWEADSDPDRVLNP